MTKNRFGMGLLAVGFMALGCNSGGTGFTPMVPESEHPHEMMPSRPKYPQLMQPQMPRFANELVLVKTTRLDVGLNPIITGTNDSFVVTWRDNETDAGHTLVQSFDRDGAAMNWPSILPKGNLFNIALVSAKERVFSATVERGQYLSYHLHELDPVGNLVQSEESPLAIHTAAWTSEGVITANGGSSDATNPPEGIIEVGKATGATVVPWVLMRIPNARLPLVGGVSALKGSFAVGSVRQVPGLPDRVVSLTIQYPNGLDKLVNLFRYNRGTNESDYGYAVWVKKVFVANGQYAVWWNDYHDVRAFRGEREFLTFVGENGQVGLTYHLENVEDLVPITGGFAAALYDPRTQEIGIGLFAPNGKPLTKLRVTQELPNSYVHIAISKENRFGLVWSTAPNIGGGMKLAVIERK